MYLSSIVSRLTSQVTALKKVDVAASLESMLSNNVPNFPAAFLLAPNERAGGNENINGVMQRVVSRFSVAIDVNSLADMRGEAALAEIESLRPSIHTALLNWIPDSANTRIEYVGGRLLYADGGRAIWADEYATDYYLRAV